jgi:hypothetical protein
LIVKKRWLWYALVALGILLIVISIFGVGILAGRWNLLQRNPAALFPPGSLLGGGHGAAGIIDDISNTGVTVRERGGTAQVVLIDNKTRIERNLKTMTMADLHIGDRVLVVGAPDPQRQIRARLIQIIDSRAPMPTPPK